uniref:Zinc finger, CCHC-type n=1 Tax=Tanacetum cinerariifolium TaxID=118510 RepID=A0A699K1C6_TANCI|nr:zinc finger, CCHC-type [Tanacetum cinerariifolium]
MRNTDWRKFWYRSLRIVLRVADTYDYLYKPCPNQPFETAYEEDKAAWKAEYKKHNDVACLMLRKMSPALQKQFESYPPQLMLTELKKMFRKPLAVEICDLVDALHSCKQALGKSVSAHVLEIKGYMDQLHALGKSYDNDMAINLINRSLNKDFGDFVRNFNMHCVGKTEKKPSYGEQNLQVGNGAQAAVKAIGVFDLVLPSGLVLKLNNCYYAPSVVRGVVSLSCLLDLRFNHTITSNGIFVSLNGLFYFSAISVNGVFEININNNVSKNNNNSIFSINKKRKLDLDSSYLWHYRLAHVGKTHMQKLQSEGLLESINDESFDKYESCISGKMTKKPFNNNIERATDLLGLIHTYVCGPLRHVSKKGASYFLTFTDDFSRYGYVYLLKHKHKVFENFKVFKSEVELQLEKKIKALHSDRGGEYLSQDFKDYLSKNGIVQHLTSPYTPQQNGDYALESAVHILNMVPIKKGSEAYVKCDSSDKLHQRSVKCIFVGYPKETIGYYFYFPPENKVIVARYGNFLERDLISQKFNGRYNDLEDDHMDTLPSENTSKIPVGSKSLGSPPELIPVRRSERTTRAPNRLCLNIEVKDDEVGDLGELANYKAAMLDPDKVIWQGIWSKWICKKKTDMDGKVHTYKARLVAKGCTQTYGINYEETFSPVADIRATRILIAIAVYYDYEIWQMDVKTAFLNGRLNEDIYMEQPEGYVDPKYPNRVCKLQRSIYGLKQASRQ